MSTFLHLVRASEVVYLRIGSGGLEGRWMGQTTMRNNVFQKQGQLGMRCTPSRARNQKQNKSDPTTDCTNKGQIVRPLNTASEGSLHLTTCSKMGAHVTKQYQPQSETESQMSYLRHDYTEVDVDDQDATRQMLPGLPKECDSRPHSSC